MDKRLTKRSNLTPRKCPEHGEIEPFMRATIQDLFQIIESEKGNVPVTGISTWMARDLKIVPDYGDNLRMINVGGVCILIQQFSDEDLRECFFFLTIRKELIKIF